MKKLIVLDKSFLIGKTYETIHDFCLKENVYLPHDLFLELNYSDNPEKIKKRAECFAKFPKGNNPVILGSTIGELLRYEIENKKPCPALLNFKRNITYSFNEYLCEPNQICFSDQKSKEAIKNWLEDLDKRTDLYKKSSVQIYKWFPKLSNYHPGQSEKEIDQAKEKLITDAGFVLSCYNQIKPDEYPNSSIMDESWFFFTWMRTELFYSINYIKKYGLSSLIQSKHHSHNVLDLFYCMLGVFAKGLASCDKDIKSCFNFLCPEGILIS